MPRKKKRVALPRVSVLALDRRALASFVSAVEGLSILVNDLRVIVQELNAKRTRKPSPAPSTEDAPKE